MTLDSTSFRQALSQFASGVTIVTAQAGSQRVGFTASSFSSVSLSPPLVLVCVANRLDAVAVINRSGAFAVNVLGIHQRALGLRFAGLEPGVADRFDGVESITAATGSPLLPHSLAWLDCRTWRLEEAGDHTVVIGEVVDARVNEHHVPLLYHDRRWQRPAALDDPAESDGNEAVGAGATGGSIGDLATLLRRLDPAIEDGTYVFVVADRPDPDLVAHAFATVQEREGLTLVVREAAAARVGLGASAVFRRITLQVPSDLVAVGLIARVSERLASLGIPCNVVSGFHHDHLFVPQADAARALAALRGLQNGQDVPRD